MKSFNRILVAIRGTDSDADLLEAAASMASTEAEVALLHVIDLPRYGIVGADALEAHERLLGRIAERHRGEVSRALAGSSLCGHEATSMIREGRPYVEIVLAAMDWGADLVVAGGGEKKGLDATSLATESTGLVENCPCPVLVSSKTGPVDAIIVPVNLSDLSRQAVRYGAHLGDRWGIPLEIVHVMTTSWPEYSELSAQDWWNTAYAGTMSFKEVESAHREKLLTFLSELSLPETLDWRADILSDSAQVPAERIANLTLEHENPLVVIGSLGRRSMAGLMIGNTAQRLFKKIACSFLTFKTEDFTPRLKEAGARRLFRQSSRFDDATTAR